MRVNSMGMHTRHEDTFLIDRPVGLGDNLLLLFKTEARVMCGKEWNYVHPGSFILYKRGSEQKYGAFGTEYENHYIHFDTETEEFFDHIGLLTDQVAYLQNVDEIENLIRLIGREQISITGYKEENTNLLLQVLLRKLAENQCEKQEKAGENRHLEELTRLRSEIYSTPARYKSIEELASQVKLSTSHFQALYKNFFDISCYEDLLKARMNGAMEFLLNSDLTVKEIATLCGYDSDTCFMRAFKNREGMSPTKFRQTRQGVTTNN